MKIAKWGNSLAVRLPAQLVEVLDLKVGDELSYRVDDKEVRLVWERMPSHKEVMQRFEKYRDMMPKGFKFDRDEANAR